MPVVSKITTDSSLGDPLLVSTVEYGDGTWDTKERTFAGFGASVERLLGDASTPTLLTKTTYETGLTHRVLRGLPTEVTKEDESGYVFSRINPKYETRTLTTGLDGTPVEYGHKTSETRTIVEGKEETRARTTQTDWKYDDFGNVTQEVNWGEVIAGDVLAGNDEVIVNRTYANLESDWILGRVASIETRDAKGTLLSLRSHFYDGEPFKGLPLGQVTRGDLRRVESWIAGEKFGVESLYNHDVHGNVVASIDGKGSRSELFYDENHQFLTREVRHVDATTILTWNAKYDGRFGAITSLIDPNGHETRVQHDALGRVTVIVKPGDSDERPTLKFERVVASPLSSVVTRAREQSGTDSVLDTVEVIDGLGRKRGSFSESTQPGSWILSDYSQFDARGNPRLTAYASEATGIVMPALSAALPGTTYVRDALGRVVVSRHPDGAEARTEYAPFSVTSWDENDSDPASPHYGTPTTTLYDAHGRVRSVIERDAGREIVTGQYAYDGLGNLLSVTDALGRQRSYAYDGRSRRTVINDPNAGTWTMTYTDGNDLESRVGPDGSRVSFLYDSFGRAVEERHSSPIVPERIAVRYHYDISTVEHPEHGNTLGQLAWVEDDAGAKYFGYDARGRLTDSTRKWFDGVEHYDWTDYDAHERMVRRGFPDRTHLSVSYDSRGLLSSVGGLATQLKWNVDGKLSSVTLGNGITDVHGYDARRRLTSMSATDGTGTMVRGFSLGLDAASRVTSITDLRPNVPVDESMTASFLYDSRYRLRQATYAAGTTTWELDDLAKITKVSSTFAEPHLNVTNIYGDAAGPGAGPDQLIRHGAEALTYDAAGRVVTDGERQLSWDVKGRLARVVRAGVTEEYVYGYNDSRALKKTTKGDGIVELTRYIAEDIEERNGSLIRYAFLGEQRLARLDPVDAGKRAAPVTKTLARADSSGMDASGRLASGTDSGIFRRANALRALWTVCAVTLLALACFLCRPRKDKRLYWSVTGATSCALAAIVFIACGSSSNNQSKELSVTERLRAESVEIATVPEGTEFYLPDAQVTPLAVTKANGQVRSRSLYHAYGQVRAQSGEHTDPFGFVGNEEDRGSGLSDFNARSYRPELGIFYAVDPLALFEPEKTIGAPSRLLAYAYAGGDPINNADPSGLVAWGEVARGLGAEALDTAKGIASSVVEMAKSDIALLSQGRIAEYAQTALIDRGEQGIVATIENVANLVDDVKA
ncbi:MAG TPA: RHS repeat-associated core domain-containing protein, partial [Polyangiaceae bacterium]|nr:RHS repeat-associated core domain-containing protein [Polyangiaceae bacterium]